MGFLKNILGKKDDPINSNEDFWKWFVEGEKAFHKTLKNGGNIEKDFFDHLSLKLDQLRDGYWFLAGMYDDDIAELVLTVDGIIKNIVFVEELVATAPKIDGWKFTALKPALDIEDVSIAMGDLEFNKSNLTFYADEINITIVHDDYQENIKEQIINGTYIFLDNYLGELNSVINIDSLKIIGGDNVEGELIPIGKLKDFLIWRQKEFVEKYEGTRYNTENDSHSSLEAKLTNGKPLFAIVNSTLLDWDRKASHPWILNIEIKYSGNESGMPDNDIYELMDELEDRLTVELKDSDGYLNIGRQTADNSRNIYFACKDFRQVSKVSSQLQKEYVNRLEMGYDIYKDKYWRSFNRFKPDI